MNKEQLKSMMLDRKNWAIIGVSPNKERIAYKILKKMLAHGYNVYPVNPLYEEIEEGVKVYKDVESIPVKIDCIDFVTPPKVTKTFLEKCDSTCVEYLWFQPGTYNDEILDLAAKKGFKIVSGGDCVMVSLTLSEEE